MSLVSEEEFKEWGDLEAEWFDGAGEIGRPEYMGSSGNDRAMMRMERTEKQIPGRRWGAGKKHVLGPHCE